MGWCTGPAFICNIGLFTVCCCCCCVCDQEDDGDDDTLTTDTLSPEANDSSRSSDSQVGAFQAFLLFFYRLFCFPAFPRMPLLSRHLCVRVCLCVHVCACVQVQALLQEVQQLREELRSRDRTIAQLTQQLVGVPPSSCLSQSKLVISISG